MQDTKILVFGKNGQVGKAFQEKLLNHPLVTFIGRDECDLASTDQIKATLQKYEPQFIINAAAYTAVDKAETEIDQAYLINAIAPRIMAQYITNVSNGQLVLYSTDYVFDGSKPTPYNEEDTTNPLGHYGKSKLAGEQAIQEAFVCNTKSTAKYFILRTSWVYGDGGNFIKTMLKLAAEREQLRVIFDQFGVPSSAQWLAEITLKLLSQDASCGIYHIVPEGETSWYGLATFAIRQAKDLGVSLKVDSANFQAIPATEYPLPAPRPYNSRMSNQKLKDALRLSIFPDWEDQVREYVKKIVSKQL
jgi:dTDP-4-dehydrorhamnose reductase